MSKDGCLDLKGRFRQDMFGLSAKFAKLSVKDESTNQMLLRHMDSEGHLFRSFKYENGAFKDKETGERVLMLTKDSWFMRVTDRLKMRCLQELAHVKYVPPLNLKTTEETH